MLHSATVTISLQSELSSSAQQPRLNCHVDFWPVRGILTSPLVSRHRAKPILGSWQPWQPAQGSLTNKDVNSSTLD